MASQLVVIESHPVQYHAPVYRVVQERFGIPVTVIYGSDFSIAGYRDREFNTTFSWDSDLLSGYDAVFLSQVKDGGPASYEKVSPQGLRNALCHINPSAILVLGYSPRFNRSACWAAICSGKPVLFRGETADHTRSRGTLKRCVRDVGLRCLYQQTAKLLYIGKCSKNHFERLGCPPEKLIFSPYCVSKESFSYDESDRLRLRDKARAEIMATASDHVILFVGKLSERKGPDLLLRAVGALPENLRSTILLTFVGDGALRDRLESMVQILAGVRAVFVGFRNQHELSPYYHAADLLALPSRELETWGLVVNEALLHGLPCITSDGVGCAPDLIETGVTGAVFEVGSVDALRDALVSAFILCGDSAIRARCRSKVDQFSVENAAEGIATAYRAVTSTVSGASIT